MASDRKNEPPLEEEHKGRTPRPRALVALAIAGAIAVPTVVAESVLANVISDHTARLWVLGSIVVLAIVTWVITAFLLREDTKVEAVEWRLQSILRALTPSYEWARLAFDAILSAVVATAIALLIAGLLPKVPIEAEAGIAILTFVVVLALVPHLSRYGRLSLYGKLDEISRQANGPGHDVIMEVLEGNLASFSTTLKGLKSENGLLMNRAEIIAFTLGCFEKARKGYRGADSNVPSVYRNRYPTYLDSHQAMLRRLKRQKVLQDPGERILVATTEPLRHDRVENREVFEHFLEWHKAGQNVDNAIGVPLNCISPERAQELADTHKLPTTDVALWEGQYALLFKPTEHEDQQVVRMCFADDTDLYPRCVAYLDALGGEAQPIEEVMNLFPAEMAGAWSAYVDERQRQEEIAGFLPDLLNSYTNPRVLDAAAGLGTETEWLLKNGFRDVVSNEIEPQFNGRLRSRLKLLDIPDENILFSYDWRELQLRFPPEIFSAVLLLGNSLCLVAEVRDIERSLDAFAAVLAPGGSLIVDERNWSYFYRERDTLLRNPLEHYVPPKAMYYGSEVRSVPISIEDGEGPPRIRLLFFRGDDLRDITVAKDPDHFIGEIDMFPILEPKLPDLLRNAGFHIERQYSDLRLTEELDPDATFFTYVATKPE